MENTARAGVVVDHQNRHAEQAFAIHQQFPLLALQLEGRANEKGTADPKLGVDTDLAAHQLDQARTNSQAQPGTAVFARGRGVGLGERLKQPATLLGA